MSQKSPKVAQQAPVGTTKPVLLSGGNPQFAKADCDAPSADCVYRRLSVYRTRWTDVQRSLSNCRMGNPARPRDM